MHFQSRCLFDFLYKLISVVVLLIVFRISIRPTVAVLRITRLLNVFYPSICCGIRVLIRSLIISLLSIKIWFRNSFSSCSVCSNILIWLVWIRNWRVLIRIGKGWKSVRRGLHKILLFKGLLHFSAVYLVLFSLGFFAFLKFSVELVDSLDVVVNRPVFN